MSARVAAAAACLFLAAAPGAAQIGINGTRQAASTGDIEIRLSPFARCGARNREAAAMAGGHARAVQREQLEIDERRMRYAGSGLTRAEADLLARRERALERAAGYGYRGHYPAVDGRRSRSRC